MAWKVTLDVPVAGRQRPRLLDLPLGEVDADELGAGHAPGHRNEVRAAGAAELEDAGPGQGRRVEPAQQGRHREDLRMRVRERGGHVGHLVVARSGEFLHEPLSISSWRPGGKKKGGSKAPRRSRLPRADRALVRQSSSGKLPLSRVALTTPMKASASAPSTSRWSNDRAR